MSAFNNDFRSIWRDLVNRDTDRIIAGQEPHNTDLTPLVGLVESWRVMTRVHVDDQFIADHAAVAASVSAVSGRRRPKPAFVFGVSRRFATATAGLAMLAGFSGMAMASDGAVPGDWNYRIDRALEDFGIGINDGERTSEIMVLNERGRSSEALQHASIHLTNDPENAAALNSAADRIVNNANGDAANPEMRENIANLLRYLAENRGGLNGSEVAKKAQEIGGGPPTENPGRGNGPPAGKGPRN